MSAMNTDSLFGHAAVRAVGLLYIEERRATADAERYEASGETETAHHAAGRARGLRIALRVMDEVIDVTVTK
jgi:hypothetical protein